MKLEIVDTVYLVAYFKRDDPLHREAVQVLNKLGKSRKVSQAALLELDLLMKARGFASSERLKAWLLLERLVPSEAVEPIVPKDFALSIELAEALSMDYFDALVAAQCILRNAVPMTTDKAILTAVETWAQHPAAENL